MENSKPLVRIENLSVCYDGHEALHEATLTVYERDFLGIIGPNGGGKTTLIKAILGLIKPRGGSITYFDSNFQPADSLKIGYLPQYSAFDVRFPITVEEVVSAGLLAGKSLFHRFSRAERRALSDILEMLELAPLAQRSISALSGGQRQRVLMARALIGQPQLLILDEPSTYIDIDSQHQLYQLLHTINEHCAIILVSHDIEAVQQTARNVVRVNRTVSDCALAAFRC